MWITNKEGVIFCARLEMVKLQIITKVTLILATPIYCLLALPMASMAPLSFLAFDSPGSDTMLAPWIFVIGMMSLPALLIAAIVVGWVLYAAKKYKFSLLSLLIPLVSVVLIGLGVLMTK